MSKIGDYIKEERKKAGLTQSEFAMRSGLGLRFIRELEHCGKPIANTTSADEKKWGWHRKCVRKFF